MDGYDPGTYGDSFADVYDDWYSDVTDVAGTVAFVTALTPRPRLLELGVGTGRIALPLADAGASVVGCDASAPMLDRLRKKPGADRIELHTGDMSRDLPVGPFDVVLATYNTFFNLVELDDQRRCLGLVADSLRPGGRLILETFVPDDDPTTPTSGLSTRSVGLDHVVLSASRRDHTRQVVEGQMIDVRESGIRMRPWMIRYLTPDQLDEEADRAGFVLESRWGGWRGEPFAEDAAHQIVVYRRP